MATWTDVRRIAARLPETTERSSGEGTAQWRVKDKLFVWERPLRRSDLAALGSDAPTGAILAARVPDAGVKDALVAAGDPYFTTPHFAGSPTVLIQLRHIGAA